MILWTFSGHQVVWSVSSMDTTSYICLCFLLPTPHPSALYSIHPSLHMSTYYFESTHLPTWTSIHPLTNPFIFLPISPCIYLLLHQESTHYHPNYPSIHTPICQLSHPSTHYLISPLFPHHPINSPLLSCNYPPFYPSIHLSIQPPTNVVTYDLSHPSNYLDIYHPP